IGDLNPSTQVKLLRVLQEREFERLGGTEPVTVNVRLIAASNSDLEKAIAAGTFREDLHYRLNVFAIFVPPLRERKTDVLLLADHFLDRYAVEHGKHVKRISTPAIDMLMAYHWPGNVRELENAIERAVALSRDEHITIESLPPGLSRQPQSDAPEIPAEGMKLDAVLADFERSLLAQALRQSDRIKKRAAQLLGISFRSFRYRFEKLGLDADSRES
ncbi:MAG: sigma 54-interacting transcriptional regulator, partial [Myxococcota bacterium]